ncbi:hypothetical protein OnM2_060067 [Erysiphe neolycopersici]|uniref:Uncharacterized protein n=1 Tax=Erysiphe neolycopersici TaxID=212602 RepID=A0A420HPR5_9PEZI|nr:hypothetical protein OnM2_060067 [Erysiphe neolycopersici]
MHIVGKRNKVADTLSRNIFLDPQCKSDDVLNSLGHIDSNTKQCVWIDGKGGYEELLEQRKINSNINSKIACGNLQSGLILTSLDVKSTDNFIKDLWYNEIFAYITIGVLLGGKDKIQQEASRRKQS